jgi:hypothetical protein
MQKDLQSSVFKKYMIKFPNATDIYTFFLRIESIML